MKLFRSIAKKFPITRSVSTEYAPTSQAWLRGADMEESRSRLVNPYSQSAWIYIAISVLADTVAHIPFRISHGKNKGETIVDSGPVYDLFQNPHRSMNRTLFWQTLVSWEALRGEFFVLPADKNGAPVPLGRRQSVKPAALIPLNPDYFSHIIEGHEIIGWRYTGFEQASPTQQQVLMPEEVVHWRNFNPYLYWRGLSPLIVAMLPAAADYAAEQFMKGLMVNNGDAGLIVTTEEMLDDTQREQVMAALESRKRHAGHADRPLFLWGKVKVDKPTVSSADLEFLENRKLNRQEIGAIFKVPEAMMGFSSQKNSLGSGSSIEQERLNFIQNTISALCRRLESAMEPVIKSFDAMYDGWFDLDALPIMQAARQSRMATAEKAFAMGVPFNLINHVYDLGFEYLPWGNKAFIANTLSTIGEKTAKTIPDENSHFSGDHSGEAPISRLMELLEDSPEDAQEEDSKNWKGKFRKFIFEQRGRTLKRLDQFPDITQLTVEDLFDIATEDELLVTRMKPFLPENCDTLKKVNQTLAQELKATLAEAIAQNESQQSLAGRVKSVFNKAAPTRLEGLA